MIISINALNDLLKNQGLELMEFGDGNIVMPLCKDGSWLTSSVMFVMKRVSGKTFLTMGIEIPYEARHGNAGAYKFVDGIHKKIAERFKVAAKVIEEGDPLPETEKLWAIESDESVTNKMSARQAIVRRAIVNLAKVGLRITGFSCHPMISMEMVNEAIPVGTFIEVRKDEVPDLAHIPPPTYCGIPFKENVNEPPPIS